MAKKPYSIGLAQKATGQSPAAAIKLILETSFQGKSPQQINSGNCDSFAEKLHELIGGQIFETTFDHNLPTHLWVELNGYHYDAETPEGVSEWKELPIFK